MQSSTSTTATSTNENATFIPSFHHEIDPKMLLLGLNSDQFATISTLLEKVKALADVYREENSSKSSLQTCAVTTMRKLQDIHNEISTLLVSQETKVLQQHFTREIASPSYKFDPISMKSQPGYVMNRFYPHDIHRIKKDGTLQDALLPTIPYVPSYPKVLNKGYHWHVANEILGEVPKDMVVDHKNQDRCDWNFGHLRIISRHANSNNRWDQVVLQEQDIQPEHMIRVQSYRQANGTLLPLQHAGIFYDEISQNYYLDCGNWMRLMNQTTTNNSKYHTISYHKKAFVVDRLVHWDQNGVLEYMDGHIDDMEIDHFEDEI